MIRLGVNIDHVATLRNARYRDDGAGASPAAFGEPDPVRACHEAELGGADCITAHLREDRRHFNDRDLELLRPVVRVKFNLEMAATDEMVSIALRTKPHMVTLVPEGRREVTTEGGLAVSAQLDRLGPMVAALREAGIVTSAFVDPDGAQVRASAEAGFQAIELHTGAYAHAFARAGGDFLDSALRAELERLHDAAQQAAGEGVRLHAGHALTYANVAPVCALVRLEELHIGHALVARAVYVGLRAAVAEMREAIGAASV